MKVVFSMQKTLKRASISLSERFYFLGPYDYTCFLGVNFSFWVQVCRFLRFDTFGGTILVGVVIMMSEEMQKIIDEESQKRIEEQNQKHEQEKRESVIIMLKKKMSIEDIMEILKITREYVLQVAQENNL